MTELERLVGVERSAPPELLRQLRVIDPTAELIYMGFGRWYLGRIVRVAANRGAGERLAASCERVLVNRYKRAPNRQDHYRYRTAMLRMRDFQPTTEYVFQGEPTGAIVRDQELMDFLWRHTTDEQLDTLADADKVKQQADAHAELTDPARGRAAWRYLFTQNHSVTNHVSTEQKARSGFKIIKRIA